MEEGRYFASEEYGFWEQYEEWLSAHSLLEELPPELDRILTMMCEKALYQGLCS